MHIQNVLFIFSIYPTEEDNSVGQMGHMPIASNTGSLPDLTVVHFQSPLTTPIDAEEAYGCSQGNLSPTSAHMQGMIPPGSPTAQSPNQRRRPGGHPSPLVLSGGPGSPQMRLPHSPPGSVSLIQYCLLLHVCCVSVSPGFLWVL